MEEKKLYESGVHNIVFATPIIILLGSLLFGIYGLLAKAFVAENGFIIIVSYGFTLALIAAVIAVIKKYGCRVELTSKRLTITKGLFTKSTTTIPVNQLNSVDVKQSIIARYFGCGNATIKSKNSTIVVKNLANINQLHDYVMNAEYEKEEDYMKRNALHIENAIHKQSSSRTK